MSISFGSSKSLPSDSEFQKSSQSASVASLMFGDEVPCRLFISADFELFSFMNNYQFSSAAKQWHSSV